MLLFAFKFIPNLLAKQSDFITNNCMKKTLQKPQKSKVLMMPVYLDNVFLKAYNLKLC